MNDLERKHHRAKELRKEIADIREEISWGMNDEADRLPELEEELDRLQFDIEIMETEQVMDNEAKPIMSTERLNRFEAEQRAINRHLSHLGREIAEMRGEPLPSDAVLRSYERNIADKWQYRDWPTGTRLLSVTFQIPQRYEPGYRTIIFPENYVDEDWRANEQARRDAGLVNQQRQNDETKAKREDRERAQLARLKAKYEKSPVTPEEK